MNRTIIRFCGFFVALTGFLSQKYSANATSAMPGYCTQGASGSDRRIIYQKWDCRQERTGFTSNDQRLVSSYPECTGSEFQPFSQCTGYCNESTIYCTTNSFFVNKGCTQTTSTKCTYGTGMIYTKTPEDGYYFVRCVSGYYKVASGGTPFSQTTSGLQGNCDPCSGLRYVNGNFETHVNASGTSGGPGFTWMAHPTGMGITSCRAYGSTAMTNQVGTFVLSAEGCPYLE